MYGVPANVHRINSTISTRPVLDKQGICPCPRTVADLLAPAESCTRTGIPPFAVGSREPWTLELLLFESCWSRARVRTSTRLLPRAG